MKMKTVASPKWTWISPRSAQPALATKLWSGSQHGRRWHLHTLDTCKYILAKRTKVVRYANLAVRNSKEIDAYINKVKQDYHRHLQGDKDQASAHDDGRQPIRGGGLEEWKVQNAKIINNGMILAEEENRHAPCEGSDKSRASTIDRASSLGPDGHVTSANTPRSAPSMFRPINRYADVSGISPRPDYVVGPSGEHASPLATHESVLGSGDMHAPTIPDSNELNVMEHLSEWESTRIADCLGGAGGDIQGFSYGDVPDHNLLFGQMAPLLGFGGYI